MFTTIGAIAFLPMFWSPSHRQKYLPNGNVDGVYWTLVYEMMFYMAVLLILVSRWRNSFSNMVLFWPLAMVVAFALNVEYLYYLVGKAASQGVRDNVEYSAPVIIFIITLFFIFFVIRNFGKVQNLRLPMSRTLGSLTCPVYLIHGNIGYILINKFASEDNKFVVYFITVGIVLLIAYFIHTIIEVKLSPMWRNFFNASVGAGVIAIQAFPGYLRLALSPTGNIN